MGGGSLWGHLDEGIAFVIWAYWWSYNLSKKYIQNNGATGYDTSVSYEVVIKTRTINWEVYAKLGVSVAGFLIEFLVGGVHFKDDEGNFINLGRMQHISIFLLFIFHAVVDILRHRKLLVIEGFEYFSLAAAFAWYGVIFFFHTKMPKVSDMEVLVHGMGILWCFGSAISILWECRSTDKFLPNFSRCFFVMGLGTWFCHMPFYMYRPDRFPGDFENPDWDQNDFRNFQFIATLFGVHMLMNMTAITIMIFIVKLLYTRHIHQLLERSDVRFTALPKEEAEKSYLLEDESEEL